MNSKVQKLNQREFAKKEGEVKLYCDKFKDPIENKGRESFIHVPVYNQISEK